jgi:iron complex outermembrane receptor protein
LLTHYQNVDNKGFQQYVPGEASLLPNPHGRIPYSRYIGEPAVDGYKLEQGAVGYAFEHRFSSLLQFRQNVRYTAVKNDLTGVRNEGLLPDLRTANRSINYVNSDSQNIALDNQLQADFATGPFTHKVLFGIDYLKIKSSADYRFAFISPIDVFAPVYGTPVPSRDSLAPFVKTTNDQDQVGVYLQDQVKFDRFTLSLTGRQDWASVENVSTGVFPTPGTTARDDKATTGRVGLSYLFDVGLAPYVSYSK